MSELLNLNRLAFFTAVIETGSFTAAGERLGVAKAVVSHQVGKLEEELGVTLILRTTRRLQATEAGRAFYDRAALILREAESAFGEISRNAAEPTGTLTLAAQIDYGGAVVAPAIAAFRERYPHMRVEVAFDDTVVDLVDAQVDVAVRVGWLTDSSNQAQRLGTFQQHLVCSAALAARLPVDLDPKGLAGLPFVANHALRTPTRWLFSRGEWERETVEVTAVVDADKTPTSYAMVLAGAGLSVFPDFLVAGDIAAGRLVRLLADWTLPAGGIHVVYPAARFRPAKVRLFVEILKGLERARSKP
ncbi:LysR family transcriptional regulator [Labrys sp. WJW]|uniref:LysR family transcriptional regulator n=1 Tax=Labrys sp. WJW TaxID=1737983 RepID=UPI0008354580|nr:LysR family transcriptional regulator [Labrys sp. WJW]OCC02560.1 LysR family transcriptional regulator [Labrys sp. WJW]